MQKFSLESIMNADAASGGPLKTVIYGPEKIGKSTLAAGAPSSLFVDLEDGTQELEPRPKRFPVGAYNYDTVIDALTWTLTEPHDFRTIAVDTLTRLEPLVWAKLVASRPTHVDGRRTIPIKSIDDYPFFAGYNLALDFWRPIQSLLDEIRTKREMNIIVTCHSVVRMVENPMGPNYEQWDLALNKHAAGSWCRWADAVLFATRDVITSKDEPTNKWMKRKGIRSGSRVLKTEDSPAYRAGNRYSLPVEIPLSWDALWDHARGGGRETPDVVRARIAEMAKGTPLEDKAARGAASFDTTRKLRGFENWLKMQLKEIEEKTAESTTEPNTQETE